MRWKGRLRDGCRQTHRKQGKLAPTMGCPHLFLNVSLSPITSQNQKHLPEAGRLHRVGKEGLCVLDHETSLFKGSMPSFLKWDIVGLSASGCGG